MKLTDKVKKWAKARDLDTADSSKQALKLMEEVGELAEGLVKDDKTKIIDSIGDIRVVLIILALQLGFNDDICLAIAYEEIKDRKGKMVNGVFVKESDL